MNHKQIFKSRFIKGLLAITFAMSLVIGGYYTTQGATPSTPATAGDMVWVNYGPEGGNISSLAMDPTNPDILYAGVEGNRVFKSVDGGATWFPVNHGLTVSGPWTWVSDIVISPDDHNIVYVGMSNGLFKSTNGGMTWDEGGLTDRVSALAMDPSDSSTLYAGTGDGVYKSTNGGDTWVLHNDGLENAQAAVITAIPGDTVLVGTFSDGLYRSTDGGVTWNAVGSIPDTLDVNCIVADPTNPSIVYLGGYTYSGDVLYKSTDSGATWTSAASGIYQTSVETIAVDPVTPTTLYAGSFYGELFKSTDGGDSWSLTNTGYGGDIVALAINPNDTATIYAGTSGGGDGLLKSTDSGTTWAVANHGIIATSISDMILDPAQPNTLYASMYGGGVFKSTDGGTHWTHLDISSLYGSVTYISALALDPTDHTTLYAGSSVGSFSDGVYKSTDGGMHWFATALTDGYYPVYAIAVSPQSSSTLYAGLRRQGVYKSTNGGNSWYTVNTGLGDTTSVYELKIDPANPAILYAGTGDGIYKTTDGGAHWSLLNGGVPASVGAIAIHPTNSNILYAGTYSSGAYKSTDGGAHWTTINTGLPTSRIQDIAIFSSNPDTVYVATDTGIFVSDDGGARWMAMSVGLSPSDVSSLVVDPTDASKLYAGSRGSGVFIRQTAPSVAINYSDGAPGSFFTINGSNFPPERYATVIVNSEVLTNTLTVDSGGNFSLIMNTQQADPGYYIVSASVNVNRPVQFTLDAGLPVRPQEGSGTLFPVPPGIAYTNRVFLPMVQR